MADGEVDEGRVELEKEAKELGWVPKDQFRGPEELWRDADEFVARGREILPIVRANNRKLLEELRGKSTELETLKGRLTAQEQTTKDLLEHQAAEIKRQVESRISDLRAEKKAAIKDGDHDLAADLEEQIDKTKDQLAEAGKKTPVASPPPAAPSIKVEPWAQQFADDNAEWLQVDKRKTALFLGICEDLHTTTGLQGPALLAKAKEEMSAVMDKPAQRMTSKSEGGDGGWQGSGGGGRSSGGKGYNDLPADAKEVCNRQEAKFVGEGKAFKTQAEWRTHYAKSVLG